MRSIVFAAALALAGPAAAQAGAADRCIQAAAAIVEPGRPAIAPATVRIKDGRILEVAAGHANAGCAAVVDARALTLLPGLIDSHVHITSEQNPNGRLEAVTKTSADRALDGAVFARRTLEAGFTTVADLGGDPTAVFALRDAIAAGKVAGPRIIAAGRPITPSGGHGDVQGFRPEVMDVLRSPGACNGPDDCRRAVREAVQGGADVIKITATGGVLSNVGAGLAQQLTDAEMKAIVETANALGRQVVAHAHGLDGVNAALRAGVGSIEHGTYADAESFRLMKASGAYLVPTILAGVTVKEEAERPGTWMPAPIRAKALQVGDLMLETTRRARLAGVKVAYGTDTGVSKHGDNARELELMVKAGYTPAEALRAATVTAAEHFKLEGEIGRLTPGLSADVVGVAGDPTTNVSLLRDVRFVMRAGVVHKGP